MKKINGTKLSLHRETLATLSADTLADVAGGNATGNIIRTVTKYLCPPSRLVCPPTTSLVACGPQAK
jgi:hypothetical protein